MDRHACYFDVFIRGPVRFRTSVGDMSVRRGRGCSLAMCVERRLVGICSPQNLQRALPAEMWTRCINTSMRGLFAVRQRERDVVDEP